MNTQSDFLENKCSISTTAQAVTLNFHIPTIAQKYKGKKLSRCYNSPINMISWVKNQSCRILSYMKTNACKRVSV